MLSPAIMSAGSVTLNFSGTLTDVQTNNLTTSLAVGDAYSLSLTYNTDSICSSQFDGCGYLVDLTGQLTVGSDSLALDSTIGFVGPSYAIDVTIEPSLFDDVSFGNQCNSTPCGDPGFLPPTDFGNFAGGLTSASYSLNLEDPTATALSNTDLPTSLDPSLFSESLFQISLGYNDGNPFDPEQSLSLTGDLSPSTPEPSTFLLFGAALAAAVGGRRFFGILLQ